MFSKFVFFLLPENPATVEKFYKTFFIILFTSVDDAQY